MSTQRADLARAPGDSPLWALRALWALWATLRSSSEDATRRSSSDAQIQFGRQPRSSSGASPGRVASQPERHATGLGERISRGPSRPETLEVVRNGTTGQPEPGYVEEGGEPGAETAAQGSGETNDMFSTPENIDYLDIPAFLRVQAD